MKIIKMFPFITIPEILLQSHYTQLIISKRNDIFNLNYGFFIIIYYKNIFKEKQKSKSLVS